MSELDEADILFIGLSRLCYFSLGPELFSPWTEVILRISVDRRKFELFDR